jgi:hypothetical protein
MRQFAADRQAQAAATVLRCGTCTVGLLEAAEQALLLFWLMPGPVSRTSKCSAQLAIATCVQGDGAAAGELDRVRQQVQQDLPHAHGIAGGLQRPAAAGCRG